MKGKWAIIVWGFVSCGQHSMPEKKVISPADTPTSLPVSLPDTSHLVQKAALPMALFTTDLNNDQVPDTITLTSSTRDTTSFDGISISISHFGKQVFHTPNPWTSVDKEYLDSNTNAIATNKFFLAKGKRQAVLLLFGDLDGAGDREDFSILDIENNRAKMVLNQSQRQIFIEAPVGLEDIDKDGRLEFIYRQIFEYNGKPDTLNGKIGTYSPYFVYTVDSNCVLNKPLTIRYNHQHYVFAGFKYDESIEIFYPNDNSKPRLWKH